MLGESLGAQPVDARLAPVMLRAQGYHIHVAGASPSPCPGPWVVEFCRGAFVAHAAAYGAAKLRYQRHVALFVLGGHFFLAGRGQSSGIATTHQTASGGRW